jgi:cytochrome bd-type quinol oxidase subunit 2
MKQQINQLKVTHTKLSDVFYLNEISQKTKLIEILLIVGSLIVAFKTPEVLASKYIGLKDTAVTMIFIFFALFSITYYILIQKEINETTKKIINLTSFLVAVSFSAIPSSMLAISMVKNISSFSMALISYFLVVVVYLGFFTTVIWAALKVK